MTQEAKARELLGDRLAKLAAEAGGAQERAAIVAWLRKWAAEDNHRERITEDLDNGLYYGARADAFADAALAIESGSHLPHKKEVGDG